MRTNRRTDRHERASSRFSQFYERAWNGVPYSSLLPIAHITYLQAVTKYLHILQQVLVQRRSSSSATAALPTVRRLLDSLQRFRIQFYRDKLLYERPITIYEQLPPDKLFTHILRRSCYNFTNFKTLPQLQQTYVPIVLQIKPRVQALYQHNRSTFPFAYHDFPTALAANSFMQQSLSWEANFCWVPFQNLTVVNIRNLSSLQCKAVQFGTHAITVSP